MASTDQFMLCNAIELYLKAVIKSCVFGIQGRTPTLELSRILASAPVLKEALEEDDEGSAHLGTRCVLTYRIPSHSCLNVCLSI